MVDRSKVNNFTVHKAGAIFGSLLMKADTIPHATAERLSLQDKVAEILINNCETIFPYYGEVNIIAFYY